MKWRTEVEILKGGRPLNYRGSVTVLGSCFASHLGDKLAYFGFRHLANPFGVIFHPVPLERLIRRALEKVEFTREELFEHQGYWRSLQAHSKLSQTSAESTVKALNLALGAFRAQLAQTSHLILTLGTAFAFRHLSENLLVANCHKLPQEDFQRELTPVSSLVQTLNATVSLVRKANPGCEIVFTVSPVRHTRDGLIQNQRSKAHLLTAIHEVVERRQLHYFPAYELLVDELRDYRFYNRDLIHPSEQAVDFVWEKFQQAWVDPEAAPLMRRIESIRKQMAHRHRKAVATPDHADSDAVQEKIKALKEAYPDIEFEL